MSTEATNTISEGSVPLDAAMKRIESILGLRYQQHQWSDLLRLLKPAARELGFIDVSDCVVWLAQGEISTDQVRILGKHLTIGESYFFREIVVFSILKEHILPDLIEKKQKHGDKSLRIWSAGCSTGEEVYSLAILLDSFLADMEGWDFSVHGTDINPSALTRAAAGHYREWSFRDLPDGILDQYFRKLDDGRYEVDPRIRLKTEFTFCNLADAPGQFPTGYDIVLCRNVLMYFTRDKIREIIQGFRRSVRDGGWLIPSLTETTLINNAGFEGQRFGEATLFRKAPRIPNVIPMKPKSAGAKSAQASADGPSESQWRSSFASILPFKTKHQAAAAAKGETPQKNERAGEPTARAFDDDTYAVPGEEISGQTSADVVVKKAAEPRKATKNTPEVSLLQIARKLADQGALDEASATAKMAVEQSKMDPQSHFMYATILREMGETSLALEEFHRALYLDHGYIAAHFAMGSLYQHLGDRQRARRHLRNALELLEAMEQPDALIDPGELTARRMTDIIRIMLGEE